MADKLLLLPSPTPTYHRPRSSCSGALWLLILMILGFISATGFIFYKYNVTFGDLEGFGYVVVLTPKSIGFNVKTVMQIIEVIGKILYKLI